MMAFAVALLIIGIGHVFAPRISWWLSLGWRIEGATPSDLYMVAARVGGAILVAVGVTLIVIGTSQATHQGIRTAQAWRYFESEMTTKNIQSIRASGTDLLPSAAIPSLVTDIHAIRSPVPYPASNATSIGSFSAQTWWLVTCRDGYRVSIIDINGSGEFGIARGAGWVTPAYQFTSTRLIQWEHHWLQ